MFELAKNQMSIYKHMQAIASLHEKLLKPNSNNNWQVPQPSCMFPWHNLFVAL
jgi:hypothetical protein